MLQKISFLITFVSFLVDVKSDSTIRNAKLAHFQLPDDFDDDQSFDKSGFIPELDFSHFFQRVNFDRSLDGFFDTTGLNQEASKTDERIGN